MEGRDKITFIIRQEYLFFQTEILLMQLDNK